MPATLNELTAYLSTCLRPDSFQDYCPNGLQVEGREEVRRLVSGVTACQALIEKAVAWQADAILVHHGYFWRGEAPQVVGMKRRRLAALLASDVSLLAYHLPLDAHPEWGNNARWGVLMGVALEAHCPLQPDSPASVGNVGELPVAISAGAVLDRIARVTGREALHIGDPDARVQRIAWCTGAAQD
ncbi:MAG: Nif3-like dinuclear metal center hexameric protein, partial [Halioglobus sp.]|nr:Nif3-like dinuclear metal center hexameric protein [Halioglobus sp.]